MWSSEDRAIAALKALAIGDALGKQTETLSREDVQRWYPGGVSEFHGELGDVIPRYRGKKYEWRIGETTDDTEQTLAVARAILRTGCVVHEAVGRELLHSRKSVHPPLTIFRFVQIGDASRIATDGDGCGAAMRVAPVGLAIPASEQEKLVAGAYEASKPTHGGQLAIAAAAAVAAAISAAIEGSSPDTVFAAAVQAARSAEHLRPRTSETTMAEAIVGVYRDLQGLPAIAANETARVCFPDQPLRIVPLAISLACLTQSATETAILGSNIGGDTDSVASIGAAIAGAMQPDSVRPDWYEIVASVNPEAGDLPDLACKLVKLRRQIAS